MNYIYLRSRQPIALLARIAIASAALFFRTAQAGEIVVTTTAGVVGGPECTLRDAITAANSDLPTGGCPGGNGADTIVLAPSATYWLNAVDNTTVENGTVQPNGLPSITSTVTLAGNGATIARLIPNDVLQATVGDTPSFRLLHVAAEGQLTVIGLTLTGGLAPASETTVGNGDAFSGGNGGAIFNQGTLVLTGTQVIANQAAALGGGIYNTGGATLILAERSVSGNQAGECALTLGDCPGIGTDGGGIVTDGFVTASHTVLNGNFGGDAGGIVNTGVLSLDHCTVSANEAIFDAGGLDNRGSATVTDSIFSDNFTDEIASGAILNEAGANLSMINSVLAGNGASDDGAISNYGTATLTNCTLRNNAAGSGGGGDGAIGNSGTMKLTGCTISGNRATSAGGIGNIVGASIEMVDCTLSGNSALDGTGGAIDNGGTVTMTNCTMSGNNALDGAGAIDSGHGGTATMDNCIITDNSSYVGPGNCSGPILGTGNTLSTDDTCGSMPGLVVAAAGLAPLGNYGGQRRPWRSARPWGCRIRRAPAAAPLLTPAAIR